MKRLIIIIELNIIFQQGGKASSQLIEKKKLEKTSSIPSTSSRAPSFRVSLLSMNPDYFIY